MPWGDQIGRNKFHVEEGAGFLGGLFRGRSKHAEPQQDGPESESYGFFGGIFGADSYDDGRGGRFTPDEDEDGEPGAWSYMFGTFSGHADEPEEKSGGWFGGLFG